jgi:hypothetical protein
MSGTIQGETADLFDADTGVWVGVLDKRGREQLVTSSSSIADGSKGDIVVSGGGETWEFDPSTIQNQAAWEAGASTTEGIVSPSKIAAAIAALGGGGGTSGGLLTLLSSQFGLSIPERVGVATVNSIGMQAIQTIGAAFTTGASTGDGTGSYQQLRRIRAPSTAANNALAGGVHASPAFRAGIGGDYNGGFPVMIGAAVADATPTSGSFFLGLQGSLTPSTTAEPSAWTLDSIGLACDSADAGKLYVQHNDNAGTATRVAVSFLGADLFLAQWKAINVIIDKNAAGTEFYVTPLVLHTNDVWTAATTVTVTTDLPRAASFLYATALRGTLTALASVVALDWCGSYRGDFTAAGGAGVSLSAANTWTKAQTVDMIDLTDGASIAVDASLSNNFRVILAGNRTLANPTNLVDGWTVNVKVKQDATGSRTLAYGSKWKFPGGAPTLTTTASATDLISGVYDSTDDVILANITKAFA